MATAKEESESACARASERMAAFVAGEEENAHEDRALRLHLRECESCRDTYRSALLVASKLGRELSRGRGEREKRELALPRRRPPTLLPSWKPGARSTRKWSVPVVIAALVAVVSLVLSTGEKGRAHFQVLEGEAKLAERAIQAGAPVDAKRGDWCTTGADGRARLELDGTELELGPGTRVLIEEPGARRLRLDAGRLSFAGPVIVTSVSGVVSADGGRGSLRLGADGLEVVCESGELRASSSAAARTLGPGQRIVLTSDGIVTPP